MLGPIKLRYGGVSPALLSAFDELNALIAKRDLQLDVDRSVELRKLFRKALVDGRFEAANLVCAKGQASALGACDVFVSLEPSELFLELLAALRALDGNNG